MKRISVTSSNLKSVGYDSQSCILEVEFVRGAIYQYRLVPALVVCQLIFAESVGSYFNKNIQKTYEYMEIK